MLTGRWLLFFGFVWVLTNILVSNLSAYVGPHTTKTLGYVVSSEEFGRIAAVGDPEILQELDLPMTQAESVSLVARFFQQANRLVTSVLSWASLDAPGILEGPVWAIVRSVWGVFGTLLFLMALWTAKNFVQIL